MDLGKKVRELRERRGVSQEDVAAAVGTTGANLSRIELGEQQPRSELLGKLADYFGVSTDYLLGRGATEGDLSPELRELFEAAQKAGYAANLKEFFDWLAAKRNKLTREPDEFPRKPDEELLALIPDFTLEQIQEILSKFEGDVVQRIAKLTPDQKKVFNEEVARILYYLELEKKVKASGATKGVGTEGR